ncbi:uncharacterized protein LOC144872550 [Branchiostoma floridae x Branchiostoma japonicum]
MSGDDLLPGTQCVAIYKFEGKSSDDLGFNEGDVLTIIEDVGNLWYKARTEDGREGLIPANYVQKVIAEGNDTAAQNSEDVWEPGTECVALWDFEGTDSEDLAFNQGELLTVIENRGPGWYLGRTQDGREGLIPDDYVRKQEVVTESTDMTEENFDHYEKDADDLRSTLRKPALKKEEMDLYTFFRAVREGDVQTVRRDLKAGVDVNAYRDWRGEYQTSLHVASRYGQTEVAELLIKNGAELEARNSDDQTSLHVASEYGQTEVAELLIKNGANLEVRGWRDQTSLHVASQYGQTEVAELLIKNGADLETRGDWRRQTSLHVASVNGQTEVAELLIKNGADLEARDRYQDTPLHEAAAGGHTGTSELLIRSGADVMTKNKDQGTPLHKAAAGGHTGTCELLIRSGADVTTKDKDQSTPLHKAAAGGHDGTCELLIRSGADFNFTINTDQDTLLHRAAGRGDTGTCELLISLGADVMVQNKFQDTPLHKAAAGGHTRTCELLIRSGADVTTKDKFQSTPLHKAAAGGHDRICELLIRSGADVNTAIDRDQDTLLHRAAGRGDTRICELLISLGADVMVQNKDQDTPLHKAAAGGRTGTCELLVRSGTDVMVKNKHQATPLHDAAYQGHTGTCELLIRSGADVKAISKYQDTLLFLAAAGGRTGLCELLIGSGADVMVKDKDQSTPLHKAAAGGHNGTCELLIRSRADVTTKDKDQSTPLHKAAAGGHTGTCELLIRSGADVTATDKDHDTPLHKAADEGHTGICELLIRSGTDVMVKNKDGKAPLDYQRDPETRRHWKNLDKQVKQEKSYHELMQKSGGVKVNRFKVFIGGKEATGKSTLKQSLTKGLLSALIQRLSRRPVSQPHDPTPGVDIGTFHVPGVGEVSVWDFAGQAEYAVTHNMFMDAENTVFVVLYNIMDDKKAQEQQVTWWLCFIKSCNPNRQPDVILVASNADQVDAAVGQDRAALVVQTMQTEFRDHLRISDEVILMDCRKTRTPEMDRLKSLLVRIGAALIQHQRDMPKLCAKVMKRLPKWCKSKASTKSPVMMWPDYVKEVKKLDRLVTEDFLNKSSRFLHHLAEILFITPTTCDPIIVLKPNWLGTDVFGRVMAPDYFENHLNRTSEDYVTREELQRVFQDIADVDLVITLLQEFQLCHTFDEETYIIPGLLKQTMPDKVWKSTAEPKVVYFGKQVQCAHSTDMFSSAFFPQVQTCLMTDLENRPALWRDGAKCVDKNVEGLIKLSPDGRAVNICVRSVQGDKVQCGKMLQQLENIVTDVLYECSPGTGTVEKVLSARALKEHRDELYSYDMEEISEAIAKRVPVAHPILKFTEEVSELLSKDEDPELESSGAAAPPSGGGEQDSHSKSQTSYQITTTPHGSRTKAPMSLQGLKVPIVLLINDEYGTSKGGISTINCQVGQMLFEANAVVYCTALLVPKQDQEAADRDGVQLIGPDLMGKTEPTLDWLTYYHSVHFPDLPKDVTCIIGHADITDTAARNIWDQRYPQADLVTINHVLPEDTDYYKGGRKAMKAGEKVADMLDKSNNAKAAFSVGKRIYDDFDTKYKGEKKPQSHHIFLPKPSKMFLTIDVRPEGEQKVVLSIGRVRKVEKLKGHDLIALTMREVVKVIKNARWCVRGINEGDFEAIKKILEKSGYLNPILRPYGTQEDIRNDMVKAHLVLMPSRSEPFGLVGLEAIAAGIPVLISDKTGLAELILDLAKQGKISAEHRNVIVKTNVNDSDLEGDVRRWASKIVDILKNTESEFQKAAQFKRELVESRYWEESHRTFLQACGIPAEQ